MLFIPRLVFFKSMDAWIDPTVGPRNSTECSDMRPRAYAPKSGPPRQKHQDKAVSPADSRMAEPNVIQPQNAQRTRPVAATPRRTQAGSAKFRDEWCCMVKAYSSFPALNRLNTADPGNLPLTVLHHLEIHLFFTSRGQRLVNR
jgi:hypothetical protein